MKRLRLKLALTSVWLLSGPAGSFDISNTPLFLSNQVDPNLILTLDDSGSMRRAYVPEICGDSSDCAALDNRWTKSAHGNGLYYNPKVLYSAPVGADRKRLATQFDAAWRNGYYQAAPFNQTVNLSSNYRPTAALEMTGFQSCEGAGGGDGGYECYMGHFSGINIVSGPMLGNKSNGSLHYFDIAGFSNVDGSASDINPGSNLISVSVDGVAFSGDGTFDKDSCLPSVQPADGRYKSRIINGNTLRLCFNDNYTYDGKTVVVRLKGSALGEGEAPNTSGGVPAYYYVFDASKTGCTDPMVQKKNDSCYRYVRVSATSGPNGSDERQNFANWYSFYRTRNLATQGSASLAFADLSPRIRLAWQALNTCHDKVGDNLVTPNCWGWQGQGTKFGSNAMQEFGDSTSTHRKNFYDWLFRLPTSGGTPLRQAMSRAGMYFRDTTTVNSPYANSPGIAGSGQASCRRNYHALMTDGIWNDEKAFNDTDDNNGQKLPDGNDYKNSADYAQIYADPTPHTLADMAFYYWLTDLAPSLSDNLSPITTEEDSDGNGVLDQAETIYWNPKNNPASWQHMVNFTIGLGLTDFLGAAGLNWSGDMYGGSYSSLRSGVLKWPPATKEMGRTNDPDYGKSVHDLWHAAINSRGRFFSAESPEMLQDSFERLLSLIEAATPTAASLATTSTRTSGDSGLGARVFQARFDTRYWNGHLYALDVNAASGSVNGPRWDAAAMLPAHNARSIYIRNSGGGASFAWDNLTDSQKSDLNQSGSSSTDSNGSLRLNWLRGDHGMEQRYSGGLFRNRIAFERKYDGQASKDRSEWVLGDIMASDPVYLGVDHQHYEQLAAGSDGKSTYAAYVRYKKTRPPMIYVGANDGMLHAFRASDGVEQFAVIPSAVFPRLHLLTKPEYNHQYFVDGSPGAGDAYLNNPLSDSSGWNSVVVSGLRAGGKAVFAVDATQPASDLPARFMWEFNANESDIDMGYGYSQPQVVRLNDGNWAAVFGNGYNSSNGGVHLYVVRLSDGALIKKITALASDSDNGLSTPTLIDSDGDRIVDMAYAGDLKGNLWKFDLKSAASSSWSVSKLFTALDGSNNPQPITVQPTAIKGNGGYWIFLGTGRLLAAEDIGTTAMSAKQSFYGLWDDGSPISGRNVLVEQSVTNTTSKNGMSLRVTSDHAVDLTRQRGWYMDLPDSGERVIAEATTVVDNVSSSDNRIIFTTAIPSADPCNAQGSSWLMELSFMGRRPIKPVFDLNQDYQFKTGDDTVGDGVVPTGMGSTVGIMEAVTWLDKDAQVAFKLAPGTRGQVQTITNRGRGAAPESKRVNWQQLL